jgi:hypothetical protein
LRDRSETIEFNLDEEEVGDDHTLSLTVIEIAKSEEKNERNIITDWRTACRYHMPICRSSCRIRALEARQEIHG